MTSETAAHPRVLDLTTTSIGRSLIRETYASFFRHAKFEGQFNVIVSIDPTYGVSPDEIDATVQYLNGLPAVEPRVRSVTIERWPRNVGLQRSLVVLFAHCFEPFGVHLEDDWRFIADLDLDALLDDLVDQDSTLIGFNSTHVSARGTFEREAESQSIRVSRVPLVRLVPPSWASDYLPLAPHLHQARRWVPAYLRALMLDDDVDRCPDERVKEHVRATGTRAAHNVLWTQDVVVEDSGRAWLASRGHAKNIGPDPFDEPLAPSVRHLGDELALNRSEALHRRAMALIPGGTQAYMKRPENFAPGQYPIYVDRGRGAHLWDVDGNVYLDFVAALGTASLGYAAAAVTTAVRGTISRGTIFSLPHPLEIEAAEAVRDAVPGAERVRFLKTGADACSAAARLARHLTGRRKLARCGYHGWHDLWAGQSPGVPPEVAADAVTFDVFAESGPASLADLLDRHPAQFAGVILAVPYHRTLTPARVHAIARQCREAGALFILDEIVTGFRLALGGAQAYFGIQADIVCLSKGLAGGMPVAAVCGPAAILDAMRALHVSTTYGGEILSLAAVVNVLGVYRTTDYIARIARLGKNFADGVNGAAAALGMPPVVQGYAALPCLALSQDPGEHNARATQFLGAAARSGVLFRRDVNFITGAHTDADIRFAVDVAREALAGQA